MGFRFRAYHLGRVIAVREIPFATLPGVPAESRVSGVRTASAVETPRRDALYVDLQGDRQSGRLRSLPESGPSGTLLGATKDLRIRKPATLKTKTATPRFEVAVGNYEKVTSDEAKNGRGERIRTSDPSVPNRVLYQAEPRPDRT
jgi:hypothetical protein